MFAVRKPVSLASSLLVHGAILAWVASGPVFEKPDAVYQQLIAPHASKLIWYDFREKLPDVSPTAAPVAPKPLRAEKIAAQEIVAGSPKAPHAQQFVWQPAPRIELKEDLRSPNLLAFHAPHVEPPPKPKLFVPPPEKPAPTAQQAALAAPPDVRSAQNVNGARNLAILQPAKAPPRKFAAPEAAHPVTKPAALPEAPSVQAAANPAAMPSVVGSSTAHAPPRAFVAPGERSRPSPFGPVVPEPPPIAEPEVSVAIVGLKPAATAAPPLPEGSRPAQFSAAPQLRNTDGAAGPVDGAILSVPGLMVRSGVPDAKPTLMARASPTSVENLRAAVRSSLAAPVIAGQHPMTAVRVASPDPLWHGHDAYAIAVQMPNITSYTGSWMIWFADREEDSGAAGAVLSPPVPLRKVDPKYYPAAMADRIEGKVRLAAVIHKDGHVDSVMVLRHVDDRLDQSAQDALDQWIFQPALRNGEPVDVDALVEIPFRLAPRQPK